MVLTPELFWDTDFEKIDFQKHSRKIIERVLTVGTLGDWFEISKYYGLERIKFEATQIRYLDTITLNFCCEFFNLKKEDFRCYTFQQSGHHQLWQY